MAEAKINESCIIGLPTCGYAFSSSRMAFIATPADEEFALELDILKGLLEEKEYESYIALQRLDPARLAFCTKICSKIITSQFCIVLLNSSSHRDEPHIKIPNPNVHMEYGLMLAFKKFILPFQHEGDALAFNIRPLDTIVYSNKNFKECANRAIDEAILQTGTTSRPTRVLTSSENRIRYTSVLGLHLTQVNNDAANFLYVLGLPMGFSLLDGPDVVYLGIFDLEPAKEIVFRLKLLLQALHNAKQRIESIVRKSMPRAEVERLAPLINKIRAEVVVSREIDKEKVGARITELTKGLQTIPWKLVNEEDIKQTIDQAYQEIGEI